MHEQRLLISSVRIKAEPAVAVRSGPWRRRLHRACAAAAAMSLVPYLSGCYTYKQAGAAPLPQGTEVSLTITDQGRVGLGERLGSGVARVNGRVANPSDSTWVVRVSSVEMLAGGKSHWSGEEVQLPRAYVGNVSTRHFSRTKTWLAVGITVGAIAATIAAVSLVANGFEGSDTKPPPDGETSRSPSPAPAVTGRP